MTSTDFLVLLLILLVVFVPVVGYLSPCTPSLVIDDFEKGVGNWNMISNEGSNSSLSDEMGSGTEGSRGMVWQVEMADREDRINESIESPTGSFCLSKYEALTYFMKAEEWPLLFLFLRSVDDPNNYYFIHVVTSRSFNLRYFKLPRGYDNGSFWKKGNASFDVCYIEFSSSNCNVFHFDDIVLHSRTMMDQYGLWPFITAEIVFLGSIFIIYVFDRTHARKCVFFRFGSGSHAHDK
jgi:hypothetical protein